MATTLSDSEIQHYVDQALAAGYSQASIDSFFTNNGRNDAGRLLSALKPQPGPGGGVVVTTPVVPVVVPPVFAVPTPVATDTGALTVAQPTDRIITAVNNGSILPSVAPIPNATLPAVAAPVAASPLTGIPSWVWLAGGTLVVVLLLRK